MKEEEFSRHIDERKDIFLKEYCSNLADVLYERLKENPKNQTQVMTFLARYLDCKQEVKLIKNEDVL